MNMTFDERQKIEKAPLPFKVFKGVKGKFGAMRLTMKRPWSNDFGKKQEGVLFLEMAPPIGNNVYDWEDGKVILALGMSDVPKLLHFFKSPNQYCEKDGSFKITIYHDKNAGTKDKGKHTKQLTISKPQDRTNFFFSIMEKNNGHEKKANVPVAPDEATAFMTLLEFSIPMLLSWTAIGYDIPEDN